jgi:hypothetical protein
MEGFSAASVNDEAHHSTHLLFGRKAAKAQFLLSAHRHNPKS